VFNVNAYFSPSHYESGEVATFCWDVSSANTAYSFTVSEVSPGSGTIDSGSGQVGGQCQSYQISEEFTGTVTLEVAVSPTGGSPSSARASATVAAPPAHLTHVSASLDSGHYIVGDTAEFCWNVSESGVAYTYEVYVATYLYEDGSGTGGQTQCTYVEVIEEDAYAESITVEIYAFAGGVQVYASASASVSFGDSS
jgi:hypothetical protein